MRRPLLLAKERRLPGLPYSHRYSGCGRSTDRKHAKVSKRYPMHRKSPPDYQRSHESAKTTIAAQRPQTSRLPQHPIGPIFGFPSFVFLIWQITLCLSSSAKLIQLHAKDFPRRRVPHNRQTLSSPKAGIGLDDAFRCLLKTSLDIRSPMLLGTQQELGSEPI